MPGVGVGYRRADLSRLNGRIDPEMQKGPA